MNPSFEPTALLASTAPAWEARPTRGLARVVQAFAGTLAILSIGLMLVAALAREDEAALACISIACAAAAACLFATAGAIERRYASQLGWLDEATGLYNRHGLAHAGHPVLVQSRRDMKPFSLVVLDFADLLEVRSIYGRATCRRVEARVVQKVKAIAGARGLAARTGKTEFTVLLPAAGRERAEAIVQRQLGKPSRIEFDAGDSEIVLVPDILCETAAPELESVDELYREVAVNMSALRAREQRRQVYLQRERERHSRPMSIPASRH